MPTFIYKAYDVAGAVHEGEIPAVNTESARFKLKELGLIPVKIDKMEAASSRFMDFLQFERKPGLAEIEFLMSKISLLLKNGVKVDRAFEIAKKGIRKRKFRRIIDDVYEDIRKGTALSFSLEKHPDIFDPLCISIVRIGEATGHLAQAFSDISSNLSFRRSITSKTRQALVYPSIILAVCLISIFFIFNYIVPKFSVIFSGIEDLPVYTHMLLAVSAFFRKYQIILIIGCLLLTVLVSRWKKTAWFKRATDALVLKIPVVRHLCFTLENLRFTSALAILLRSGVVLSDALDYAVKSIGNIFLNKRLLVVRNEIRQGNKLSETMAKTGFLPDTFDGLLEVGEQTGNLSEVFFEMEKRLKTDYEDRVTGLITLVEPILIIIMGLVVGSVVVVMLLSMVSINDISF